MKLNRVNNVLKAMEEQGLNQMIISSPPAIFYLTGKWFSPGERMIALYLNTKGNHKLVVNKLFPIYEDLGVDLVWYTDIEDPIKILCTIVDKESTLGVDKNWPAHFLIKLMDNKGAKAFVNSSPIIDRLRMIKDEEEIALMKKSSQINDKVMLELWNRLEEGKTEKYYANLLVDLYENQGVNEFSFSPIIAVRPNGADPHHHSSNDTIKKGHSIVIDIGGVYNSYCSDMTRTVFWGEAPSERHAKIYNIVKEANLNAIGKVKEGMKFSDIDKAARDYIEDAGYGEYFTHRTGHSIGIEDHDFGDVSSSNHEEIKAGMIFSIEPGIYLKDDFGVRIEDLVLVTKDGCEVLNSVTKDITII
ncbi:aminopeptidase P family protein [Clostridium tertium]|uniref:M24 family metallopeptidase n=1 Tax=Clostridium tertium TaxID=1559 RepID=UPI00115BE209|nr:aminopeptidase P family protein [Clostridium tertium]MDB1954720.1 aminopeptidase P family protein [Clostridium tertium]MDB1960451.1 aminopeptidase P family protein [Clostridium tertium]MDB1962286.1 aminopeptidase P family protein [Clostridium tertium]MDB1966507.1 aminopeptidase P family protein [Clostridium tertium]MDI9217530.1 aminopeptidase P family protein [Clostridium tertium]